MNWKTLKLDTSHCQGPYVVSGSHSDCNKILSSCTGNLFPLLRIIVHITKSSQCAAVQMKIPGCKDPLATHSLLKLTQQGVCPVCLVDNFRGPITDKHS